MRAVTTKSIPIFRAGVQTAADGSTCEFSAADLQAVVDAYDPALHEAPLCVGHPRDNLPAYGWVKGLEFADGELRAVPDQVDPAFAEMVNAGRFKKRSASFYLPDAPTNPKPGSMYLRHVAFLGAQPPAVKGLRDVQFADAEEGVVEFGDWQDRSIGSLFRRLREWLISTSGLERADQVLPNWEIQSIEEAAMTPPAQSAQSTALYAEGDAVSITAEDLAAREAALKSERDALDARAAELARRENAARLADFADFAEGLVKEGRLLPKDKAALVAVMGVLPEATFIEFGEGDQVVKDKPALQVLREFLAGLPKQVDFTERAPASKGAPEQVSNAEIADRTRAYVAKRAEVGHHISYSEAVDAVAKINSWGFAVTVEQMNQLARDMGESSLFARTGGAPSLAVGMASIFGHAFGKGMLAIWYHFAIMFEAIFILTTLDAGTRVGRFMLQDMLGNIWPKMGQTSWMPSVMLTSGLVVAGWGYFLYIGVIDPNGGVNILWPLFGIANQMLAAIALCVATGILVKSGKFKVAWITGLPLVWLLTVTTSAAWQKIFSDDIRVGFFAAANDLAAKLAAGVLPLEKAAVAPKLIFNQQLDAYLTMFLVVLLWVVVLDMLYVLYRYFSKQPLMPLTEVPYQPTRLLDNWVRD